MKYRQSIDIPFIDPMINYALHFRQCLHMAIVLKVRDLYFSHRILVISIQIVQWIETRLHYIPEFLLYVSIAKHDRGVDANWIDVSSCNSIYVTKYVYTYNYIAMFYLWDSVFVFGHLPWVVSIQSYHIQIMNHSFYHGYMCIKFTFCTKKCLLECFRLNWLSLWCPMFGEFTDEPLASCVVVYN